ncbi:hypothetical protein ACTFR4_17180 [Bacillus cereus group sp. MYBK181-1]|uniref:hypothetical protein n=1 Tax=Bacillus TaxID=1386 RepID=UPI0010A3D886|nr:MULTISPECIES: hypothetical protein [Bacillus]MDA4081888.1 hypothetical protein [Bacillus cereus]QCC39254.1 hypothetical protein C3Y97_05020 [Bacillus sp. DU-106]
MNFFEVLSLEFYNNSFENDLSLLEQSETFNFIFTNNYEVYFVKYIEELNSHDVVWKIENEIYDFQKDILSKNSELAYNLNFVIVSDKINSRTRRILEQDKYTSKKIIISTSNLEKDIELLPFKKKTFIQSNIDENLGDLIRVNLHKMRVGEEIIEFLEKSSIEETDIDAILELVGVENKK